VGGDRVIDRVVRALSAVTDEVVMIANDPAVAAAVALPARADRVAGIGPLAGLDAALAWADELGRSGILAVSCDMPFLSIALLDLLVQNARTTGAAAVLPESDGPRGVEPLVAYYSTACADAIAECIARGDHRLIGFHAAVDVRRIQLDVVREYGDPEVLFMNMNTPADRERAELIAGSQ
jgi:molybdopterin-guanine dinucleotide biosynthesis protein A